MNTRKALVLVYEDDSEIARDWADKIQKVYRAAEVQFAVGEDFRKLLEEINRRRTAWRRNEPGDIYAAGHAADEANVIVVDYDLFGYLDQIDTTGSRLAYLLRCFTRCGFIVVLNAHGTNVFDLSLGSPTADFADIHIGSSQIGNPGLWKTPFDGYRPWYWPIVPHAQRNFEQCVQDVKDNWETPILEFLKLDCVLHWWPRRARAFLTGRKQMEEMTFQDFIESTGGGIAAKDTLVPEQRARVAAARIGALLNLILLPEQSVLVDAPHLVSRFPSVLRSESHSRERWNQLCNPVADEIDDLLAEGLKAHRYPQTHWLWRPAWYWPQVNQDEAIEEVHDPWAYREPDWVFCEDISQFIPLCCARDFRALLSPPFIPRFLFDPTSPDATRYVPQTGQGGPQDSSPVEYVPQAVLGL